MEPSLHRAFRLIDEFRERLALDLGGMSVLTEAGSGPFLYSPLIAASAGAGRVAVIAPDSPYASHSETRARLEACFAAGGLPLSVLEIHSRREDVGDGIDLFLNLGFVRPIDAAMIARASPAAVISYMSEAWEFRPGDVDLEACAGAGIPVAGVNENFAGFGVFDSCGQLAIKLLFEAGVEVAGCSIVTIGGDRFGEVVDSALRANGAASKLVAGSSGLAANDLAGVDALVIATYSEDRDLLGGVSPGELAALNPSLKIVSLVGGFDRAGFEKAGIACFPPGAASGPHRMTRTLADLGDRPVLALHSLGIKVGELLYRKKKEGAEFGRFADLVQPLPAP
jgi:hypothetical protein